MSYVLYVSTLCFTGKMEYDSVDILPYITISRSILLHVVCLLTA